MKKEIHPDYVEAKVVCSCGNIIQTRATKPELHIEICSTCHPFFTGKQKFVDAAGRVERFEQRYKKFQQKKSVDKQKKKAAPTLVQIEPQADQPETRQVEAKQAKQPEVKQADQPESKQAKQPEFKQPEAEAE